MFNFFSAIRAPIVAPPSDSFETVPYAKKGCKRAWSGPGAEFLNFGTACIYLLILLWIKPGTSKFANSCNVASTSKRMSNYSTRRLREQGLGRDPLKNAAIVSAQNRRATIRLGIYTLIAIKRLRLSNHFHFHINDQLSIQISIQIPSNCPISNPTKTHPNSLQTLSTHLFVLYISLLCLIIECLPNFLLSI